MKLSNIKLVGRMLNPETGKPVNVRKGRRMGYGTDHLFYTRSGERVFISDRDYYSKWKAKQT